MHYIVGTQILVNERTVIGGSGLQPVNAKRVTKKTQNSIFQPGVEYTLYHIKKLDNGCFNYSFTTHTGDVVDMMFGSIQAAENTIAIARNEQIPDYTGFHRGRQD